MPKMVCSPEGGTAHRDDLGNVILTSSPPAQRHRNTQARPELNGLICS